MNLNQITLPVTDVERSSDFYRRLGLRQIVRAPHYARFECPQGDACKTRSFDGVALVGHGGAP